MQQKMLLYLDAKKVIAFRPNNNVIAYRCTKYHFIAMDQMNCVQYHKGYLIWLGLIPFNIDEGQKSRGHRSVTYVSVSGVIVQSVFVSLHKHCREIIIYIWSKTFLCWF